MAVMVVDIGSSSVRVLLFDETLQPIPDAAAVRPYQFTRVPAGASVINPDRLREMTESAIDEILRHPRAAGILVVGMATFVGNILGIDTQGHPVTPVYTYADTRSENDVMQLKQQVDRTAMHQRTGCPQHTAYLPGRLLWLQRTEPDRFERVKQFVDVCGYLYQRWFGEAVTSYSVASWSGMLDESSYSWDDQWLETLSLNRDILSPLADYSELRQGLSESYAQRWPVLRNIPFCLAVGDGAAANIGSGCDSPSHIALTVGTTAALRIVTKHRPQALPSVLWRYVVEKDCYLIGGATTEGGSVFAWAQDTLKLPHIDVLEAEIRERPPDAHGLTVLPLLGGERSPGYAVTATGTIHGLRLSTSPLDILQATLESVALRLSLIYDALKTIADRDAILIAGGGALHASPAWAQIIANAVNCPLHVTLDGEVTARGTALLALRAISEVGNLNISPEIARVVEPEPRHAEALRAACERQSKLYDLLYGGDPTPVIENK
jgi:gluconokinase